MQRSIVWYIAGLTWTAGLYGVLQLQYLRVESLETHGVCGPWGCGPPIAALVACHAFWLALILPGAILASNFLSLKMISRLGFGLISFGLCGLVAVASWEAATWLPQASSWQRQFVVQRFIFAIVTTVDAPLLQSLVVGTGLYIVPNRHRECSPLRERQSVGVIHRFTKQELGDNHVA